MKPVSYRVVKLVGDVAVAAIYVVGFGVLIAFADPIVDRLQALFF